MTAAPVPVILALGSLPGEADVVAAAAAGSAVTVVRRCRDTTDLLAAAADGTSRAALVSASLPRLTLEAVTRLHRLGVVAVGAADPDRPGDATRLRALGVGTVTAVDGTDPAAVGRAIGLLVSAAERHTAAAPQEVGDSARRDRPDGRGAAAGDGVVVAVWGPTGAPGRSTVAVTVADELARSGNSALLVDADSYGGALPMMLGLVDDASGLAVAVRRADLGGLDLVAFSRCTRALGPRLRVLTGIRTPDRWSELRPAALQAVWSRARDLAEVTVIDTGFCLERDDDPAMEPFTLQRNAATITALAAADVVVAVGGAEPLGLARLAAGLPDLRAVIPETPIRVVVTRVRRGIAGRSTARQVSQTLHELSGLDDVVLVPDDRPALDRCQRDGTTLADAAPRSAARIALRDFAATLPVAGRVVKPT
ncbi:MAG: hypothetical protein EPO13_08035 [Actinomycetota bacterium]|nr:MAG: hypothetical protein EPO13_08035 [Actinomycetota bacterium]